MSLYEVSDTEIANIVNTEINKLMASSAKKKGDPASIEEAVDKASQADSWRGNTPQGKNAKAKFDQAANDAGIPRTGTYEAYMQTRFDAIEDGVTNAIQSAIENAQNNNIQQNGLAGFITAELTTYLDDPTTDFAKSIAFLENQSSTEKKQDNTEAKQNNIDVHALIQDPNGIGGWIEEKASQTVTTSSQTAQPDNIETQEPAPQAEVENTATLVSDNSQNESSVDEVAVTNAENPNANPGRTRTTRQEEPQTINEDAPTPTEQDSSTQNTVDEQVDEQVDETDIAQENTPIEDQPEANQDDAQDISAKNEEEAQSYLSNPIEKLKTEDGRNELAEIGQILASPLGSPADEESIKEGLAPILADIIKEQDPRDKSDDTYLTVAGIVYDEVRNYFSQEDAQKILNNPNVTVAEIEELSKNAATQVKNGLENSSAAEDFVDLNLLEKTVQFFQEKADPSEVLTGITEDGQIADFTGTDLQTMIFSGVSAGYIQSDTELKKLQDYQAEAEERMAERKRKEQEDKENNGFGGVVDRVRDGGGDFLGVALPTGLTRMWEGISAIFVGLFEMIGTLFEDRSDESNVAEGSTNRRGDVNSAENQERSNSNRRTRTTENDDIATITPSDQERVEAIRNNNPNVRGGVNGEIAPPTGGVAKERDNNPFTLYQ